MKVLLSILFFIGIFLLIGCQARPDNIMVLLDEKIQEINISISNEVGDMNLDYLHSFQDNKSIKLFETAIRSALKQKRDLRNANPDYDIVVSYGEDLPKHAIHLWLGEEGEQSVFMYMVEDGETYVSSEKVTKQLRELIEEIK
ncbi:hypothetical protein [Ornithinibacillus halotolerans]|uniref:YhfM-like domain-containing protein n=1 Tax=Ornithinibacillus halotolerans TaxID=1274357 RepID=A0A916S2V8_9BACI|nr:hypothetical protein [Ornithinibacillus halotolerans]GGA78651.1 hypothetical protein GCM10008025_22690 [Ornithinibacillus halotolerans]